MRTELDLQKEHPHRLSWGAIFGGAVMALGVWVLLYALGLALGLSAVDAGDPASLRKSAIGTGIWSAIAPLIALFIGGIVAGRSAGVTDRLGAALHGGVMWGLTTLAGIYLIANLLGSIIGGAAQLGGQVAGAAGSAAAQQGPQAAQALGLDMNDAIAPINQELQQQGLPPVTASQLQSAVSSAASDVMRGQPVNRELLVTNIAQNTNLSRAQAERVAGNIEQQLNQAQGQAGGIIQDVQQGALSAVESSGKAFWWTFAALLFGLLSALLGAAVGVTKRQQRAATPTRNLVGTDTTTRVPPRDTEVYP